MTLYDRVGCCRVLSMEDMDVTAADSDPLNPQHHFLWTWSRRFGHVLEFNDSG